MAEPRRHGTLSVTLPQLERIYALSRWELLRAAASRRPVAEAHDAVQGAFAYVARARFSFADARAVLAHVHDAVATAQGDLTVSVAPAEPEPAPPADWPDVLRRAGIEVGVARANSPSMTTATRGSSVRAWLRSRGPRARRRA